ncbi:uncharacterized protein [Amphiura filiformis]|uniref:uncharacterized protein n=1 Tax=Amphiura filiformis TaxID=82378 RepID=UPI003B21BCED
MGKPQGAVSRIRKRKATDTDKKSAKKPKQADGKTKTKPKPKAKPKPVKQSPETKAKPKTTKKPKAEKQAPTKEAKSSKKVSGKDGPSIHELEYREREGYTAPLPTRNSKGELVFEDCPRIRPNMSPKEVLQAGSFGGTYFRPIKSGVTGEKYTGVWKELPKDWVEGLEISKQISSCTYHLDVNTYGVKCGGSLEMWESSGWIDKQDPYGWFQWYCRFYLGRRTDDDERQIGRWDRCTGVKGRWRNNLIAKCARSGCAYDNTAVSPVVRQTLQHWGYRLTEADFNKAAKRFK